MTKTITGCPLFRLDRVNFLALVVKTFCPEGTLGKRRWRAGWGVPRASVKIGFLHLMVMYNSAQEASDHRERSTHTKKDVSEVTEDTKSERRGQKKKKKKERGWQSMQEVVKKRPIISARERGQFKRSVCLCVRVCASTWTIL